MTARPTYYPDWAVTDVVDPVSGQHNCVLPPTAYRTGEGWTRGELPPRNYLNWWQNDVGLWMRYLDERIFGDRENVFVNGVSSLATGVPTWRQGGLNPEYGWIHGGSGVGADEISLMINCDLPRGAIVSEVHVNYYNGHPTNDYAPHVKMHDAYAVESFDDTAPTLTATWADFTALTAVPAGHWGWRYITGLAHVMVQGRRAIAVVTNAVSGDMIAGVRICWHQSNT